MTDFTIGFTYFQMNFVVDDKSSFGLFPRQKRNLFLSLLLSFSYKPYVLVMIMLNRHLKFICKFVNPMRLLFVAKRFSVVVLEENIVKNSFRPTYYLYH